ncbi:hypothetical protein [Fusobacterium sp. PH5-44]|uniref:hypothetical protein n=1 Tax=unclassified Fusobacterium TaxID=2648384 RepID=UPI003D19FA3A
MEEKKESFDNNSEGIKTNEEKFEQITSESENALNTDKSAKTEKLLKETFTKNYDEKTTMTPIKKVKKYKKVKKIKKQTIAQSESDGCLIAILGMIFPYIGIVLYLLWRKSKPESAVSVLKGSAISITFIGIILSIILGIKLLAEYLGL